MKYDKANTKLLDDIPNFKSFIGEKDFDKLFVELVFEKVRQDFFEIYPSRFSCTFLTEKLDDWIDFLHCVKEISNKESYTLYSLHVEETSKFIGDAAIVAKASNKSLEEMEECAKAYWSNSGEIEQNEILFQGKLKVIGVTEKYYLGIKS